MADFKIARVSGKAPRAWSFKGQGGVDVPMETYTVMVEDESDPVEVNRKPGDKPAVGEVLTGRLENTDYGKRFKKERKPFTPGTSPKDEAAIRAMWSLSQAIAFLAFHPNEATLNDIEPLAKDLFSMVDRVKTGEPSGLAQARKVAEEIGSKRSAAEEVFDKDFESEPVNVDDIPF